MGKFILNGKEYGSSDIINVSGVYMNPNDEIIALTSYTQSDQWEYTATKDCIVYIEINNAQGYGMNLLLDGKRISCIYANNVSIRSSSLVYLRTGQTLSLNASNYSGSLGTSYAVYGVIEGTDNIGHTYSTTEQVVGKWIDGKPVYEKTYTPNSPSTSNTTTIVQDISSLNLDTLIDIKGTISQVPLNWYLDNNASSSCWINDAKTGIAMKVVSTSSLLNKTCNITMRYTKTTD